MDYQHAPHVHTTLSGRWLCKVCPKIEKPTTPVHITIDIMGPNDIFVFGSNTQGIHGAGAAKYAKRWFGAVHGVGEGLIGNSYAFPTLNSLYDGRKLSFIKRDSEELWEASNNFGFCAVEHPELVFWVTKVGCGLAGYAEEHMIDFFMDMPMNVIKPERW